MSKTDLGQEWLKRLVVGDKVIVDIEGIKWVVDEVKKLTDTGDIILKSFGRFDRVGYQKYGKPTNTIHIIEATDKRLDLIKEGLR